MDTSILEDIGLTNAEIKVYLALLELGSTTAGPILEKSGLQNSVVHMTLHKLLKKGMISFIKKGKIRYYQATDPRNIIDFIEEKKERFKSIIPELLIRQKKQEIQEAEVYEGFKGFKTMVYEVIKDAKKGDEWLFFAFYTKNHEHFEYMYNFYKDFDKVRAKKGMKTKGIFLKELEKYAKRRDIDYITVDFPIPMNVSIFNNKVYFTPWEDKQISFLIHSRQLADTFRKYFYLIWNQHKKK